MADFDYDLVVVGAGAAGLSAATVASGLGSKVLLVDKERSFGGECLRYGCIPSKAYIKSAAVYHAARTAGRFGVPALKETPVNLAAVRERMRGIVNILQHRCDPATLKSKYNIDTFIGHPWFNDPHEILIDGKKVTMRSAILATGSRSLIPQIEGLSDVSFITNRQLFELDHLPASMLVIGNGANALEAAQTFARFGTKVTLIAGQSRLLPGEDADVAGVIERQLLKEKVRLILEHSIQRFERTREGGVMAVLESTSPQRTVEVKADIVFLAVGRQANVEGLGLENINLAPDPSGIKIDAVFCTKRPNIYAVGDVNGTFPYAHAAIYQARNAATRAILKMAGDVDMKLLPVSLYLDPEIASVGYNEIRAKAQGLKVDIEIRSFSDNEYSMAEGEDEGFIKVVLDKHRPVGVQIVGTKASKLITEWISVVANGIPMAKTVPDLLFTGNPLAQWISAN